MVRQFKRPCLWPRCKNLSNRSYCELHRDEIERSRTADRLATEPYRAIYATFKWKRARDRTVRRDGNRCQARINGVQCEITGGLNVHHIIPLKDGGEPFELSNLVTLCRSHHEQIEKQTTLKR